MYRKFIDVQIMHNGTTYSCAGETEGKDSFFALSVSRWDDEEEWIDAPEMADDPELQKKLLTLVS